LVVVLQIGVSFPQSLLSVQETQRLVAASQMGAPGGQSGLPVQVGQQP
jgi:hypothetical protein